VTIDDFAITSDHTQGILKSNSRILPHMRFTAASFFRGFARGNDQLPDWPDLDYYRYLILHDTQGIGTGANSLHRGLICRVTDSRRVLCAQGSKVWSNGALNSNLASQLNGPYLHRTHELRCPCNLSHSYHRRDRGEKNKDSVHYSGR
jgi:hypothetical protein